jgi:hypothetical protein
LLLHGDGTNGAQNNTFLDGSTNNFTITRNGNTTQGTFSPFSVGAGEWSNYFDGTGDYLSLTGSSLGSGNFTLEFWVYLPTSGVGLFFDSRSSDVSSTGFAFYRNSSNYLTIFTDGSGTSGTTVIPTNQWVHLALVRNSGTIYAYMNGVQQFTRANSATMSLTSWKIFAQYDNTNLATGYLSNFRITTTAVYTAAFTPPTAPLTAISNTVLLTCQSNRFVDNSTNAFAITRNGDVRVTPFSPFAPSAAYSASTNGGSGYFDGTGDYLSIADAAGLRFGTGNFTIQAWIYRSVAGAVHSIAAKGGASTGWVFQVHSDNKLRFTQTTTNIDSTGTIPAGAWTHVAVVREGTGTNQTKLYINGVNDGQATVTTDFNQTEQLNIGADRGNANPMNGYIAGFKYVVGTAETITVPTAPPTGGTALLNFTNAGIFDNTGKNNLETVADAQIDTGTKKYGTGSMEFDGTGDRLVIPYSPYLLLESGDFTVEMWLYKNANTAYMTACGNLSSPNTNSWQILSDVNGTKITWFSNDFFQLTGTTTLNTSTWYHVAFVRSGSSFKLYVNGTEDASTTNSVNFNVTNSLFVGHTPELTAGRDWNGFIDDLRITKGVARYTTTFTPPTSAFLDE